ncbi:MAG: NAD(+) synthase [Fibrobacter sp.]|nr:NAD(+) synthase [Fibrobacter sp.]
MPPLSYNNLLTEKTGQLYPDILQIDCLSEINRICNFIQSSLVSTLKRRGIIIALSGGIDSSVTAALCVKAIGHERVKGLFMPEQHTSDETYGLAKLAASSLGIEFIDHDISGILSATGCYERQNEAIRQMIPQYQPHYPFKIALPTSSDNIKYQIFSLIVKDDNGNIYNKRMTSESYLSLVAATNFKQRTRKMLEYYYADKYNFAVAGSPNRLEYDQGFFVKSGDGAADIKPIAHLYKTQVYALAASLGIPEEIRKRTPTTDTYPLEQTQEEFYFSLPYQKMDLCLFARNNNMRAESVCEATGLTPSQAKKVFADIDTKRKTTRYQHLGALMLERIRSIDLL